jgi:RNA polymerase II subunit A small phosphatase-like protein
LRISHHIEVDDEFKKTQLSEMSYEFYKSSFDVLDGMYRTMYRPGLHKFLKYIFSNFNVAIWTAAGSDYAHFIVDEMEIDKSSLMFFYTEKNCTPKYEYGDGWGMGHMTYKKNISKLKKRGYDMSQILMVDDKPEHIDSYGNVIKIKPFYGDSEDQELLKLIEYLDKIKNESDYRKIEKRGWDNQL